MMFPTADSAIRNVATLFALLAVVTCGARAAGPVDPAQDLNDIRVETRRLLASGSYEEAIRQLTALRSSQDATVRKFAQEYLGVARERKGQIAFARAEYQRFLDEFPDAPEASRVQMRLDALLKSSLPIAREETPAPAVAATEPRGSNDVNGLIRLDYRNGRNIDNEGNASTSMSLLGTDVDLSAEAEHNSSAWGMRVAAGHYEDLLDTSRRTADRVLYLYADYQLDNRFELRIGRQKERSAAMLGRFDGLHMRYSFEAGPAIAIYGGLPVDSSRTTLFGDERKFVGFTLDSSRLWDRFSLRLNGLHQTIGPYVDRQTIGGEARYVGDGLFAQGVVDYDLHFGELNAALFNVNSVGRSQVGSFNFSYSYRKSPFLSTRNALIGQRLGSIDELTALFLADEIETLAMDRTLNSQMMMLGYSRPLSSRVSLSTTLTWFLLEGGVASGGVPAMPDYSQYQMETRLTLRDFLHADNFSIGFRYAKQENLDSWSVIASSNARLAGKIRFGPRLRVDVRNYEDGRKQINAAPGLRLEYRNRGHSLFAQTGYYLYLSKFPTFDDQKYQVLLTYIGYQYRF